EHRCREPSRDRALARARQQTGYHAEVQPEKIEREARNFFGQPLPGGFEDGGAGRSGRFRLAPPAYRNVNPQEGITWKLSPCASFWRPESISATRPAAGLRR